MSRKLIIYEGEAEALKRIKLDLGAALKQKQVECEILLKERPELLDMIDTIRNESNNFQIALNKKVAELEECKKELNAVKAREYKYFTELSVSRQSYLKEKDELCSTREKLVELYEHHQLLERSLETKTALLYLAESTEKDLKEKLLDTQRILSSRSMDFEQWSSQKEKAELLLDETNSQIEKLLAENERLKSQESYLKGQSALVVYMIKDLEELVRFYDAQSNTRGRQNLGFPQITGPNDVKYKSLSQQISTVFTEALLIMKHFEELKSKNNELVAEIKNSGNITEGAVELDEIARISSGQKTMESQIVELVSANKNVREENKENIVGNERTQVELDTTGQNLKNELKSFNIDKWEGRNLKMRETELRQGDERISQEISSAEPNLSCTRCFTILNQSAMCLPCTHVVCNNCKPEETCKQCDVQVSKTVKLSIIDEIPSKITYNKQDLEDMNHILAL